MPMHKLVLSPMSPGDAPCILVFFLHFEMDVTYLTDIYYTKGKNKERNQGKESKKGKNNDKKNKIKPRTRLILKISAIESYRLCCRWTLT